MNCIASNITSPLGLTTEQNYQAVRSGSTALSLYEAGERGVPFSFCAALFPSPISFESIALQSAAEALSHVNIKKDRTIFILSTTKGNINESPSTTATTISHHLGIGAEPIVVCNACISGAAALITAIRLLQTKAYDYAVVTGADVQTDFTIAGFQSLKALSPQPCRPFDEERLGLNLGEAAATIVLSRNDTTDYSWHITDGAIRNDAYHISTPHPKGEGCYQAIKHVMRYTDPSVLATINAHGTATMYNDQMESKAIERANLTDIPVSALKGYYGHTLGAAGILETILTARALDDGIILATKGYNAIGVSGKIDISNKQRTTNKCSFLKIISGFGGCNAALLVEKRPTHNKSFHLPALGKSVYSTTIYSASEIAEVYKNCIAPYPRFHKMDLMSRLLTATIQKLSHLPTENTAIILFSQSSSVISDRNFRSTISDKDNFYPSPSLFVYTLPNIAIGEAAIRYNIKGETSLYILPRKDETLMRTIISATLIDSDITHVVSGWIDCTDEKHPVCELSIMHNS